MPVPTVQEILKASGMTDAEIAAYDAKVLTAFGQVLTTAEQAEKSAREASELAENNRRLQQQQLENEINPALDKWSNDAARLKAENAWYRAQNESAREAGFIPADAPGYQGAAPQGGQPRGANGEYVAGASGVPGSPGYMTQVEGVRALSNVTWTNNEYYRLYGTVPPDDFETLLNESGREKRDYREYVERKYGFAAKRAEISANRQKEHDDKIRKEAVDERDRFYAERMGNNPNIRVGQESQFAELRKGVSTNAVKDPTTYKSKQERQAATTQMVQKDVAENMAGTRNQ